MPEELRTRLESVAPVTERVRSSPAASLATEKLLAESEDSDTPPPVADTPTPPALASTLTPLVAFSSIEPDPASATRPSLASTDTAPLTELTPTSAEADTDTAPPLDTMSTLVEPEMLTPPALASTEMASDAVPWALLRTIVSEAPPSATNESAPETPAVLLIVTGAPLLPPMPTAEAVEVPMWMAPTVPLALAPACRTKSPPAPEAAAPPVTLTAPPATEPVPAPPARRTMPLDVASPSPPITTTSCPTDESDPATTDTAAALELPPITTLSAIEAPIVTSGLVPPAPASMARSTESASPVSRPVTLGVRSSLCTMTSWVVVTCTKSVYVSE